MISSHDDALRMLIGDTNGFTSSLPTEPLLFRGTAAALLDRLSFRKIDDLLAYVPLRRPFLDLTRENQRLDHQIYSYGFDANDRLIEDWINPLLVAEALEDGATLFFNLLDRLLPDVGDYCRSLSRVFGTGVSATAFVTPAASRGFDRHHDRVSAFIVQIEGEKHWDVWAPAIPFPLSDYHPWTPEKLSDEDRQRIFEGDPDLTTSLAPGDVLWLPRGWVHNVYSEQQPSLHLTLGLPDVTPHSLLRLMVDALSETEVMRRDLPLNYWRDAATLEQTAVQTRDLIIECMQALAPADLAGRLRAEMLAQMLPARVRPVAAALGLPATSDRVVLLPEQIADVVSNATQTTLHLGDREITLEGTGKAAVDAALRDPGRLIDAKADPELQDLVAALLQQGVAVPA